MLKNVENPILDKAIIRANTHYYLFEDAIELVNLCQQYNLPVLGIDSFIITDTKTQPFMEHSIDYSNILESQNSFDLARAFLESKKAYGFVFEIVY